MPIGVIHNIDDLDNILPQLITDLEAIRSSLLAPWQKLNTIRTFLQSALTYALRAGDPKKKSLDDYHKFLIRVLRDICCLPQRSSQAYFFSSKCTGGLALQDPKAEADVQCIVQTLKILSSADPTTRAIARAELRAVVRRSTKSNPTSNVLSTHLSGSTDKPLDHLYYTNSSLWSRCRNACRRLKVTFHFSNQEDPAISSDDSDRIRAKSAASFLRRLIPEHHASRLLSLPDQGKVAKCLSNDRYANGSTWHNTGLNLLKTGGSSTRLDSTACRPTKRNLDGRTPPPPVAIVLRPRPCRTSSTTAAPNLSTSVSATIKSRPESRTLSVLAKLPPTTPSESLDYPCDPTSLSKKTTVS